MDALKPLHFLLLFACLQDVNSARILAFIAIPSYSHQMFYQQIWRELALRGHDMVVVTTDPTGDQLPNLKEIAVTESYKPMKKLITTLINKSNFQALLENEVFNELDSVVAFQMGLPQIQPLIHNKTEYFDLIMVENFVSMHIAFKHLYQCPMIGMWSMDAWPIAHMVMGNPVHGILYPSLWSPIQGDMSLMGRIITLGYQLVLMTQEWRNSARRNELIRKVFGEGVPDINDLFEQTDMIFINAHPLFSAIRPFTPGTISIAGGIHMRKPKPLPKDLQGFLDTAPNCVIYFSLGTNVKGNELSSNMRQTLMDTLSQVSCKVLWKFEDDTLPGKPANVKIIKWAPQQDVLRHPNVKLFITQGGAQSLEEALYCHVPMVVLPFLADQENNADKVVDKGLGLKVNPHTLSAEVFKAAIMEVLDNQIYRDNVKKLAEQIQDEPLTPLAKAVWWTEYVLRHKGTPHLKGPRIPMYQYYYLDVLAILVVVVVTITATLIIIIKKLLGKEKVRKVKIT